MLFVWIILWNEQISIRLLLRRRLLLEGHQFGNHSNIWRLRLTLKDESLMNGLHCKLEYSDRCLFRMFDSDLPAYFFDNLLTYEHPKTQIPRRLQYMLRLLPLNLLQSCHHRRRLRFTPCSIIW